jgi:hypothetical protein
MNAFPLAWPEGWPRSRSGDIKRGRFNKRGKDRDGSSWRPHEWLTVSDGVQRVLKELDTMGIDRQDVIISTNVRTRLDGLPRSDEKEPDDSGAACYWQDPSGTRRVMAIDIYSTVADNLAAIAATLEAMRAIERHGGARILERAFTGFSALPAPGQTAQRTWRQVFGFESGQFVTSDLLRVRYRTLAAEHHPDRGGSNALMAELNTAYEQAKRDLAS